VVYLWDAAAGAIEQLCECKQEGEHITSVKWMADGTFIALVKAPFSCLLIRNTHARTIKHTQTRRHTHTHTHTHKHHSYTIHRARR
jgi:hypothetical protein